MAEWGRKEYAKKWPSRTPVWTWTAVLSTFVFFAGMLTWEYERSWTAAERLYLSDYLKSGARGQASANAASRYTLLEAVVGKGQRLVIDDEIEPVPPVDGRPGWRLTDEGVKDGIARLTWVRGTFNDRGLHRVMSDAVYAGHESVEFYKKPFYEALAFLMLALFVAVPKDRKRRLIWKHGRRLRGPELVTTAEFNEKLGKSKVMRVHLPDGVAFINEEQTWMERTFHKNLSRWARVPRDREAMHFLIVGDSGTGKSAAIRQILSQVWERGEAAIVYDPAMEYLPQFYNEARGDVILNPMDARCPFWAPGDSEPRWTHVMGRFMSPDSGADAALGVPVPFAELENPQSLNLYSYARNNPLSLTDPDGQNVEVCVDGAASCLNYTDQGYQNLLTAQNGQQGINLPTGSMPNGDITCGGQTCGTATFFEPGAQDETGSELMGIAGGMAADYVIGKVAGAVGSMLGRVTGDAVSGAAQGGAKVLLSEGTKQAAKDVVEGLADGAQKASAKRAVAAATRSESVSISQSADGTLTVTRTRTGFDGSQTFTKTIDPAGNSSTVQTANDAAGNLVHYDPKN